MSETAELASNLSAIVLLSVWWAFLSTLDALFTARDSESSDKVASSERGSEAVEGKVAAFDAEAFLGGARCAYEMVLEAYAAGDLESLRPLLSDEVMAAFADNCAGRMERGEILEFTIIGIESAEIVSVEPTVGAMEVTVLFRAQIVSAERGADGEVIAGDPDAVSVTSDLWTFSRPVPVDREAWVVVATDEMAGT